MIFSERTSNSKAAPLCILEREKLMRIFELFSWFHWASNCLLALEWGTVICVNRVSISRNMTEWGQQKYCITFCQSAMILKEKQFVRFIRCCKIHQFSGFLFTCLIFFGWTWNLCRLLTSLFSRHRFLWLLVVCREEMKYTELDSGFQHHFKIRFPHLYSAI